MLTGMADSPSHFFSLTTLGADELSSARSENLRRARYPALRYCLSVGTRLGGETRDNDRATLMNLPPEFRTERLYLRRWQRSDRALFAKLNADPRVVEFLRGPMSRQESDASVDRIENHFEQHGFGLWAVEIPGITPFAGFIGLSIPRFDAHFMPCVEIGWRLDAEHWNRGYATEGARAALEFGFTSLQLKEILSFTTAANVRSRRVMEKLGMTHSPSDDFDHPLLSEGHPLRQHVLYRLARPAFEFTSVRQTAVSG
jgi:RimJ/RimL family protein N-acetyltransferase